MPSLRCVGRALMVHSATRHFYDLPSEAVLENPLDCRAEDAPNEVGDRLGDVVVAGERVLLAPLVQDFNQFRGEPSLMAIQFSDPTVLVFLRNYRDDVMFPEPKFVVVTSLKIQNSPRPFSLRS